MPSAKEAGYHSEGDNKPDNALGGAGGARRRRRAYFRNAIAAGSLRMWVPVPDKGSGVPATNPAASTSVFPYRPLLQLVLNRLTRTIYQPFTGTEAGLPMFTGTEARATDVHGHGGLGLPMFTDTEARATD